MLYRITNTGEARTVDHLAVFQKGQSHIFTEDEVKAYEAMSGVPFAKGDNMPEGFKVEVSKEKKTTAEVHELREAEALKAQETNVQKLNDVTTPAETEEAK